MRSFSPCKKAEVKALVNAELFSNREISRRLKVSEASVRLVKKKIESREELSPNNCETPYKNNDLVSHQRQGYWTSVRG
ncbi:hypothetical protein TNCV_4618151 [Trichonephila clavipes]|nr:hypothetical protein TNCV_4618151 [Trichonephila clavipes]